MASSQEMKTKVEPQTFKYFLVLDFEATCEHNTKIEPQVKCIFILLQDLISGSVNDTISSKNGN